MTQISTPTNGGTAPAIEQPQIQARIIGQYIKDLSFENPNVAKVLSTQGENPKLDLQVNVNGRAMGNDLYESAIHIKATANGTIGVIYELEVVYAGLLKIEKAPAQAIEPMLLINGPALVFPFLRRLIADITREGGYPPLLLDPIDFGGLYVRRKQEEAAKASALLGTPKKS